MDVISTLKEIDVFQGLEEEEFHLISEITKTKFIKKNTIVFSKGDENHSMYIIKEGSVEYMFLPEYIETYGIEDYQTSIVAFEKVTQFTSAEFAVRPFLIRYPEKIPSPSPSPSPSPPPETI